MSKKSFIDNPALAFIDSARTHETQPTKDIHEAQDAYYRLNLKLRVEYRQFLNDEAWKARISVTEYVNRLIAADMSKKE